jgi:hypothetical protein
MGMAMWATAQAWDRELEYDTVLSATGDWYAPRTSTEWSLQRNGLRR